MKLVCALLLGVALGACSLSPLGRRQLKLYPETEMARMGLASFATMKRQVPQSTDARAIGYVRCVAVAVLAGVPGTAPAQWEVVVFEDETANAFALPGGRIGVHTGLLKVATSQDQLAAVLGHEVAHVTAGHANERISQLSLAQAGLTIAQVAAGPPSASQQQLFGLLGMGAQLGILLPYSRQHETEADLVGLDYMAAAGFDPRRSVDLWRNMSRAGGQQPPEFLSTHPSHGRRIQDLENRMPSAMRLYESARQAGRRPACAP
jgi:predicted Zn-dependent protease